MSYHTAREIVVKLKGRWNGKKGMACCPAHADKTPSLSVTRAHDGRVLVYCFGGCAQSDVIAALQRMGLWGDGPLEMHVNHPGYLTSANDRMTSQADREKRRWAQNIWDRAKPIRGTHADAYLRARAIRVPPMCDQIGYVPALKHYESDKTFPALVARITDDRGLCAVQRIYLDSKLPEKAAITPSKMTLGPMGEGAVRLRKANDTLGLAEGLETALSVMQLYGTPVWATCGTARLHAIEIPKTVKFLTIFADNGKPGWIAANKAAEAYERQGLKTDIILPGADFADRVGDFNDVLRARP